jgi:hypothetical protein
MAAAVKYETFVEDLMNKLHDLFGTNDTVLAVIHTDAPVVATDVSVANLTQITGTGYAAGDIQNDATRTGGTVTMTGVGFVWTAGAADWTSTARYVSIYNDTSLTDRLILSWDYGATFAVGNGETFTLDFGASVCTLS